MTKFKQANIKGFDKSKEYRRLGIFDSGVGGLSILKYLSKDMDDKPLTSLGAQDNKSKNTKEIIYLADNGRFPYGEKSPSQIISYTEQIVHWLEQKEVDLVVFGCNTASAIAGKKIIEMTTLPVLDLIDPVAQYVSQLGLSVGILATEATVKSGAFSKAIKSYAPKLTVKEMASAQLVNIVERGNTESKETKDLLANYVKKFINSGTEIIVLSCTHFSFLKEIILTLVDDNIQVLDPSELIAQMLTSYGHHEEKQLSTSRSFLKNSLEPTFFATGDVETFCRTAAKCLGYPLKNVNHLAIADLESLQN